MEFCKIYKKANIMSMVYPSDKHFLQRGTEKAMSNIGILKIKNENIGFRPILHISKIENLGKLEGKIDQRVIENMN